MGDIKETLERAAALRLASRLFEPPSPARARNLGDLADTVPEPLRRRAEALAARANDVTAEAYHRLLGHAGACRDTESAYRGDPLGTRGQLIADVAGFYHAFSYTPSSELAVTPDHIAVELDFLAFLAFKEAYATFSGEGQHAETCRDAANVFLGDHLALWADEFTRQLTDLAGSGFYADAAQFLESALPAVEHRPTRVPANDTRDHT